MKKMLSVAVAVATLFAADIALADGKVSCPVTPRAERRPPAELTAKLKSQGWVIRKMQMFNNCYEVYGFDEKGQRAEAFFDPKTFEKVGQVKQPS